MRPSGEREENGSMDSDPLTHAGDADAQNGAQHDVRVLPRVTSAMVRIYKEQFGRGPENARSYFAGPDMVVCVLADSLTPVERSMRELGEHQRLRDIRMMFQYAAEEKFRAAVEQVTGRRVVSFMSAVDVERDLAAEIFILEPRPGQHGVTPA
jgi:uncharacterized protein YbcI